VHRHDQVTALVHELVNVVTYCNNLTNISFYDHQITYHN